VKPKTQICHVCVGRVGSYLLLSFLFPCNFVFLIYTGWVKKKVWFAVPDAKLYPFFVQLFCTVFFQCFLMFFWSQKKSANLFFSQNQKFRSKSKILNWITESRKICKIVIRKFAIFSSGKIFTDKLFKFSSSFLLGILLVLNIRCSVETWRTIEKQFFSKNDTRTENCQFSNYNFAFLRFCDSIFLKFYISIETIHLHIFVFRNFWFWEKKGSRILLGQLK